MISYTDIEKIFCICCAEEGVGLDDNIWAEVFNNLGSCGDICGRLLEITEKQ